MNLAKKQINDHSKKFDPDNLKDFIDVFLDNISHGEANTVCSGKGLLNKFLGFRNIEHKLILKSR